MESFTLFRTHLAMSGITKQQSRQKWRQFNLKNSIIIIFSSLYVASLTKLLDEVSTFEEYMSIIYMVLSSAILIVCYISIVLKTPALFGLIHSFEHIITKSKYQLLKKSLTLCITTPTTMRLDYRYYVYL